MAKNLKKKRKKKLFNVFKNNYLKTIVEEGLHEVNFLDVTLNLLENTYKPYKKPGHKILYIHKESTPSNKDKNGNVRNN